MIPINIKNSIYTLGATEEMAQEMGFGHHINRSQMILKRIFGAWESLCSYDTYQFEDYSKVFAPRFDPEKKPCGDRKCFPSTVPKPLQWEQV